jgi:hypothetical protein
MASDVVPESEKRAPFKEVSNFNTEQPVDKLSFEKQTG